MSNNPKLHCHYTGEAHAIVDEDADVKYVPFVGEDGQVGYRCEWLNTGETTYIYLNASGGGTCDEHKPNVFVYEGRTGLPWEDGPLHFYDLEEAP